MNRTLPGLALSITPLLLAALACSPEAGPEGIDCSGGKCDSVLPNPNELEVPNVATVIGNFMDSNYVVSLDGSDESNAAYKDMEVQISASEFESSPWTPIVDFTFINLAELNWVAGTSITVSLRGTFQPFLGAPEFTQALEDEWVVAPDDANFYMDFSFGHSRRGAIFMTSNPEQAYSVSIVHHFGDREIKDQIDIENLRVPLAFPLWQEANTETPPTIIAVNGIELATPLAVTHPMNIALLDGEAYEVVDSQR